MTDHTTCHGCRHLSYGMPLTPADAAYGGQYHCAKFGASMPASELPLPIEPENPTTGNSCKEPK